MPLIYAYSDGRLFLPFPRSSHRLDGIQCNDKVSFCVIKTDDVMPVTFTTHFRSVIIFGRIWILTEEVEKRRTLECMAAKYLPGHERDGQAEIASSWDRVCVVKLAIDHSTGKAAIEIMNIKRLIIAITQSNIFSGYRSFYPPTIFSPPFTL